MAEPLIVLVPLLVLAVVMLFAFSGCSLDVEGIPSGVKPTVPASGPPLGPVHPPTPTYVDVITKERALIAWWRLSEGSGAVAVDSAKKIVRSGAALPGVDGAYSGGYNLTAPGVLRPRRQFDTAADFDGSTGYVEVKYHPLLNPGTSVSVPISFSVEAWVNPAQPGPNSQVVVLSSSDLAIPPGSRNPAEFGFSLLLVREGTNPPVWVARVGSGTPPATHTDAPQDFGNPDDGWRYLVMSFLGQTVTAPGIFGGQLTLEVDDGHVYRTSYPVTATYARILNPRPLRIAAGRNESTPDLFFSGRIDEVALYNPELIKTHFDAR